VLIASNLLASTFHTAEGFLSSANRKSIIVAYQEHDNILQSRLLDRLLRRRMKVIADRKLLEGLNDNRKIQLQQEEISFFFQT